MTNIKPLSPFELRVRMIERHFDMKMGPLGKAADISHATIQKWIDKSYEPRFSPATYELKKLADFAGVTLDWLLSAGPIEEIPEWVPTQVDLKTARERLSRRNYPVAAVDEVLLGSQFLNLRNAQDLFDFCEAQLSKRGLTPKFDVTPNDEGPLGPKLKGKK